MDYRIIDKKLQILRGMTAERSFPVAGWQARTADNPAPGRYVFDGPWKNVSLPAEFPAGKTVFLRAPVTVPASAPLKDTFLSVAMNDMEGLLSVDGHPHAGIDWAHPRAPIPGKGRFQVSLEFMSVPAVYWTPDLASRRSSFSGASIVVVNRDIDALYFDIRFAWETARVVTDPRRKPLLEDAVEAALLAVDLTLPRERLLAEVSNASRILRRKLAAIAPDPESGSLYAVGHTHIDTAWLWPLRETVRKCGRTFSTACRLMEQYPDFHFTCSQPQLYQYTQKHFPDVFRQIRRWVKSGRWETAGAMWVEADCNVTSGESLIRQMLYGLDYFRREFGTRTRLCWLPDVFGYPSSLPGILAGCGVKHFYTYKLHWQAANPFPSHLFRWRGIDGTEVLAHVVNHLGAYNNVPVPEFLHKGWSLYAQKAEYPEVIFPFGYGDGGGGVNEEMMEMFRRAKGRFPGLPAVRIGMAADFFNDVEESGAALPSWDGELYVETHRGTYTTQSAMKRANRASELLLRDAEILGSLAGLSGEPFKAQALREAWELTLVHQFHDILPGSSIGMVYAEALRTHAAIQDTARRSIDRSVRTLAPSGGRTADAIRVLNTLSWARQDTVQAEIADRASRPGVKAPDGTVRPAQVISRANGRATVIFSAAGVPSMGAATFRLVDMKAPAQSDIRVTPTSLENRFFRITLDKAGGIRRLIDKENHRDVIARGAVGNDLQLMQDGPEGEDAWNVHATNDKRHYAFEGATSIRVVESGPVRGIVRVKRTHRRSTFEQDIVVYADLARIDFVTRVDWQERHTMLKVAFPLEIRSTRAAYEVQFGAYERPTHRNTSWDQQKFEVPAQRWADLSEAGYGVSLLNDSRYGYDAKDNVLRLTLLRSTIFPDPEADRGRHEFTYALFPHAGTWADAATPQRAWELNVPARAVAARAEKDAPVLVSYIGLDGAPAIVEALKPAEDGRGLILRVYEPDGGRGDVSIRLGFPVKRIVECNLVEEDGAPVSVRGGAFHSPIRPFQIRTFRLM